MSLFYQNVKQQRGLLNHDMCQVLTCPHLLSLISLSLFSNL